MFCAKAEDKLMTTDIDVHSQCLTLCWFTLVVILLHPVPFAIPLPAPCGARPPAPAGGGGGRGAESTNWMLVSNSQASSGCSGA